MMLIRALRREVSNYILQTLDYIGVEHGITFKGDVNSSVDFLDTTVTLNPNGNLSTKMYVKPTDATHYLH